MEAVEEKLTSIPLDQIWVDDEFNSRGLITPASVVGLAESIYKEGLYQNPVVQEKVNATLGTRYKCVMGHRRIEAYRLNRRLYPGDPRWEAVPCKVKAPLLDAEALTMNLRENMDREKLNMLQEARGIAPFKRWGWSSSSVAKQLGVTKKWVDVRYGLLALPEEIQSRAAADYLTQYQVEECIKKSTREEQLSYVRALLEHKFKGEKLAKEGPHEAKKFKKAISVMAKGTARSIAEMLLVQESIQDCFGNKHPAAMALAWAMGVISYEEFVKSHIEKWALEDGIEFKHHEGFLTK